MKNGGNTSLQHVRLDAHKGLKGAILRDLQKINVICGPNNSGKTTVLECLADRKLSTTGRSFSADAAKELAEESATGFGWHETNLQLNQVFKALVEKAIGSEPIWFGDDLKKLFAKIDWNKHFGNWSNPSGRLQQKFAERFSDPPSTVLIPAKRRFETIKRVQAGEEIAPDGSGILNFLFTAKNQDTSAPSRAKFNEICVAFSDISGGYEFDLFVRTDPQINPSPTLVELFFRRKGMSWIKASDCGLGLQDLLIVLYFALASEHNVILVEEPENHLHPEIQRRLVTFLRGKTQKQFFISTHSSVFLNTNFADRVFICRMSDSVRIDSATSRAHLLTELGYSIADNLVSDVIVLCEGPKDKPFLDEFFLKMGLTEHANIKVWPLGGDIMDQLDLSVFQEAHKVIALVDGDPGSSAVRKRFLKKCEDLKIPVTRLDRYSLENYFSLPAIGVAMKVKIPPPLSKLEPEKSVVEQLGFQVKNNSAAIAKEMRLEDIKGTDLEVFFKEVERLVMAG